MSNSMDVGSPTMAAVQKNSDVDWAELDRKAKSKQKKRGLLSPQSLPSLLRGLGAITLLASVSIYLLQGWEDVSDLTRYLLLLAHTAGLAVVGVLCSRWLKEQKGARLLLMLTLVFISANFAIIGGFSMSLWGEPVEGLLGAVTWVVSSTGSSLTMILGSLIVLVPLTYLGFNIAARRSAKAFSFVFLLSNFMLLIPTRNEFALVTIMLSLLGFVIFTITKARSTDVTLTTREGLIARLILFVPLGIMLGRNMMHSVGEVIPLIVGFTIFVVMRQVSISLSSRNVIRSLLEFFSIIPVLLTAGSTAAVLDVQLDASMSTGIFGFGVISSIMLFELSARASGGKGFYSVLASLLIAGCLSVNVFLFESSYSSFVCFVAGIGLAGFGYISERRVALILGSIVAIVGAGFYLLGVFSDFDLNGWFSMAAIGVGAIVLGSYIEKHGEQLKLKIGNLKNNLDEWGY